MLKDSFDFALDLMSEVVRTPSFPQDELDRVREQALSAMGVNMQDPEFVADAVIDRLVYGFHPYGLPGNGTPESLPIDHARRSRAVPQGRGSRPTTRCSPWSATSTSRKPSRA